MQTIKLTSDSRATISLTATTLSIQVLDRGTNGKYEPTAFITIPRSKQRQLVEALQQE